VQGDQAVLRPIRYKGRGNYGPPRSPIRGATAGPALLPNITQALIFAVESPALNRYTCRLLVHTPRLRQNRCRMPNVTTVCTFDEDAVVLVIAPTAGLPVELVPLAI
jgi:hypothetical protein